jgi:hypothetical protein
MKARRGNRRRLTKNIPILAITDDMVGAGLVNSMARPDGNTTGISILATELDGKRQELLIEAVPGVRRINDALFAIFLGSSMIIGGSYIPPRSGRDRPEQLPSANQ